MKEQTENNSNMDMKNFPTIHCLEVFSVLFYLHYGAITCHACIYGITKMRIVSHAQKTDASNVTWRVLHRMLIT